MDQTNCPAERMRNRIQFREVSCTSNPPPDSRSTLLFNESNMSTEESLKGFPVDNLDSILGHCFKQFKLRDAFPRFFFKVKPSRFGPPKSRRRILIAPPMSGKPPYKPPNQPCAPQGPQQKDQTLEILPETEPTEEETVKMLEAWIAERKQFWDLLDNCVKLEQWLTRKQSVSELEENVLGRIKECKEAKKAKLKAQSTPVIKTEVVLKKVEKKVTPIINAPYPESLLTLQNLLYKQKLKLVDLFGKIDKTKKMKFRRVDFIKIIQETKVPISKNDLEDVVVYLTSSKKGDYITSEDLAECQKIWQESLREQGKQDKGSRPEKCISSGLKVAAFTGKNEPSTHCKARYLSSHARSVPQLDLLEVPPINTEPECRHLSYSEMEIVGKRYKEMRRQLKRKTNPLDFAEQCRIIKSGDPVVDGHCKPSTIKGEMGELVDQHRLATFLVFTQCVKICEKYGIPITERVLKRALLYPGDNLITDGINFRKMRQPGGYYNPFGRDQQTTVPDQSRSPSREKPRKRQPEVKKKRGKKIQKTVKYRWKSFAEFEKLMRPHSKRLLPPVDFPPELLLIATPEALAEQYAERELRRMFAFLNPLTDPNSFWPGRLLDKLRLYLPQEEPSEGDCLFSHVSRTRPVYPAVYNPHRCWPISDQGYVTYGDPESRKHNYYI